jgi:HTH-type transcriptional regulator/antitoxin HigA
MEIKPINTDAEYKAALEAVSRYFENEPELGSSEAEFFESMLTLIKSYEEKEFF